ncbi:solute carrier family 52, riboflavin transporter, member 3-A-like [Lytechinus pictus]|uniref:solute carrier family 52, riboflavin transporter, member 3-A-like n=1 Tax=Lytechinus pictus TaxID=7653 RepID=UPI0030B9E7CC
MGFQESLRKFPVILLVILFGTGSWVAINGLWVELPLLVAMGIPEGYNLASYLVIIIQIANIGPLIFTIMSYCMKGRRLEVPAIYIILPIGIVACLLLVFFWDVTTYVGGVLRSTPLLSLSFFISIVDCTSSVAFTPFMSRLKSIYLTWYFVGEGFSALLPSLVALGQGVGNDECVANYTYVNATTGQNCTLWMGQTIPARFPPDDFFWFLFAMMTVSLISFFLLNTLPLAKREYVLDAHGQSESSGSAKSISSSDSMSLSASGKYAKREENDLDAVDAMDLPSPTSKDPMIPKQRKSKKAYVYIFLLLGYVNALSNGILPSIQSYSCGAYSFNAYLLAATLGNVANPVACFIVMLFPQKSLILVGVTAFCGTLISSYCLATAALSPTPPLQDEMAGTVFVVLAWILVMGLFTYTKATIGWILRNEPDNRKLLIGFGAVTQLGSLVGACIMFPLVNVYYLFTPYYASPCDGYEACPS